LNFDRCGTIAATAPIPAAIIPSTDATIVGLSNSPPEDVTAGCTVATGEGVTVGRFVDFADDPEEEALNGGSVPNTSVTWPGTT
jgi:hypothetical protein